MQLLSPSFIKIYSQTILVAGRQQQSSREFKSSVSDIHTGIDPVISCLLVFKLFFFFFPTTVMHQRGLKIQKETIAALGLCPWEVG